MTFLGALSTTKSVCSSCVDKHGFCLVWFVFGFFGEKKNRSFQVRNVCFLEEIKPSEMSPCRKLRVCVQVPPLGDGL